MKTPLFTTILCAAAGLTAVSFVQGQTSSPAAAATPASTMPSDKPAVATAPVSAPATGVPSEADMQKMMQQMIELGKPNENHKLLAELAGNWSYKIRFWMGDVNAKPQESSGTAVRKPIMDGRYFTIDVTGKMQMPGPDGKMKDMNFKGMGLEAYDNVQKKFVSSWVDSMGTGIMMSEGTYDAATKTFTYTGEVEAVPGMKQKIREVIKIVDKDHHNFEWYETRGGAEVKTMEIAYTRAK